ncbi:ATP-dependent DNA helicase PIF1-like protein [Tanacetum coccineum]
MRATIEFPEDILIPDSSDHIGDEKTYESSDSVGIVDMDTNFNESLYTGDFLSSIKFAGLPQDSLKLKIGAPVMCMRNIYQRAGLCNRTRLQIMRLGINIIEAKIISGGNVGGFGNTTL